MNLFTMLTGGFDIPINILNLAVGFPVSYSIGYRQEKLFLLRESGKTLSSYRGSFSRRRNYMKEFVRRK